MTMKFEFNGMEQRLDAVLEQFVVAKSDRASLFAQTSLSLKNTLSEMFDGCSLWGIKKNEYFSGKVKECARKISSYPQLIDLARKWEKRYNFHTVMHLLFSQGLLSHIDREEMRGWTRKLDEIFEMFTDEEYIPREGDGKRDTHMLLFYLNAYAKVELSDFTQEEKQGMYDVLNDYEKRETLSIVSSIYFCNPRLCSGYTKFAAIAGCLIAERREHYASLFLTAERFARHERGCTFDWQSKRQHFYNLMVDWSKEKSQRDELVGLLSVIFPRVESWNPADNNFHLIRGKKHTDFGLSDAVKNYVDDKHKDAIGQIAFVERQLDKEVEMNRKEHMTLSEKLGKLKGTTTIKVDSGGVYNENVGEQRYDMPLLSDGQHDLQKGASL